MVLDDATGIARTRELERGIAASAWAHENQVRIQFWCQLPWGKWKLTSLGCVLPVQV